jgi:hypothetical protein
MAFKGHIDLGLRRKKAVTDTRESVLFAWQEASRIGINPGMILRSHGAMCTMCGCPIPALPAGGESLGVIQGCRSALAAMHGEIYQPSAFNRPSCPHFAAVVHPFKF